ncbi:MAG TPA: hypothetical protein VIP77_24475 [Jiangellaceae bacterium]
MADQLRHAVGALDAVSANLDQAFERLGTTIRASVRRTSAPIGSADVRERIDADGVRSSVLE